MLPLKNVLYNLHPESGSSHEYAKGVLVGAISACMELSNRNFDHVVSRYIQDCLPNQVMRKSIPDCWLPLFEKIHGIKLVN